MFAKGSPVRIEFHSRLLVTLVRGLYGRESGFQVQKICELDLLKNAVDVLS